MATATVALSAAALGCGSESVDSVEGRLSEHEFLTTLLPDDATQLSELDCSPATAVDSAHCTLIYATGMSLGEVQEYYRAIYDSESYQGRGWSKLIDNLEVDRFIWRMEWRDETYKVVVTIRESEQWLGTPGPEATKLVINATVVERK